MTDEQVEQLLSLLVCSLLLHPPPLTPPSLTPPSLFLIDGNFSRGSETSSPLNRPAPELRHRLQVTTRSLARPPACSLSRLLTDHVTTQPSSSVHPAPSKTLLSSPAPGTHQMAHTCSCHCNRSWKASERLQAYAHF